MRLPVWKRHRAADFGRRLVLAQALVNDLPQQVVVRPGEIFDFGDQRVQCTRQRRLTQYEVERIRL